MREAQTVFVVNYSTENQDFCLMDNNNIISGLSQIEAIVLTPEQYKQDMILFADFCDKGFLRGVGKWWKVNKNNEEPTEYTTSELFDIYTNKEKV